MLANYRKVLLPFVACDRMMAKVAMITFPRRVPHKRSGSDDDDRDESIALVLVESRSIVRWLAAAARKLCGKVIVAGFNTRG